MYSSLNFRKHTTSPTPRSRNRIFPEAQIHLTPSPSLLSKGWDFNVAKDY